MMLQVYCVPKFVTLKIEGADMTGITIFIFAAKAAA
jgi:stage V sporulation protein SpoVS